MNAHSATAAENEIPKSKVVKYHSQGQGRLSMKRHCFGFLFIVAFILFGHSRPPIYGLTNNDLLAGFEAANKIKISGRVTDPMGLPLERIYIGVTSVQNGAPLGFGFTDKNGRYEIAVIKESSYWISAEPGAAIQVGNVRLPSTWMQQDRKIAMTQVSDVNFVLGKAGTIWLRSLDLKGNRMYRQDFFDPSRFGIFPVDIQPYGNDIHSQKGSLKPVFWGWEDGTDKNPAVMLIPVGMKVKILGLWEVPSVGSVILEADNGGRGYTVNQSELLTLDIVAEFAKTEARKLRDLSNEYTSKGYSFSYDACAMIAASGAMASESMSCGDEKVISQAAYKSLTNTLKAKESLALEAAEQDIEKYRKLDVKIVAVDEKGERIPNFKIRYDQESHDFAFGGGYVGGWYFGDFDYQKVLIDCKNAGFNYMHIELPWIALAKNISSNDWLYEKISRAGLKSFVADGGLVWIGGPSEPDNAKGRNVEEFKTLAQKFVRDLVSHYKKKIQIWNVFNEPEQAVWFNEVTNLNEAGLVSVMAGIYRAGKTANPKSILYFNLGWIAWPSYNPVNIPVSSIPYGLKLEEKLKQKGVDYDALGLEIYYGTAHPPIDMLRLSQTLDYYGDVKKPYFISEAWLPSGPLKESDKKYYKPGCGLIPKWYWHGLSEEAQAAYARYLYTLAFSKPSCLGIIWLATWDDPNNAYANVGLFDRYLKPKKAFYRLRDLLGSWVLRGEGTASDDGKFIFRGFAGEYEIQASSLGYQTKTTKIHVEKGAKNTFTIVLAKMATASGKAGCEF